MLISYEKRVGSQKHCMVSWNLIEGPLVRLSVMGRYLYLRPLVNENLLAYNLHWPLSNISSFFDSWQFSPGSFLWVAHSSANQGIRGIDPKLIRCITITASSWLSRVDNKKNPGMYYEMEVSRFAVDLRPNCTDLNGC